MLANSFGWDSPCGITYNCEKLNNTHVLFSLNAIPDNSPQMIIYGNKAKKLFAFVVRVGICVGNEATSNSG